ncbi:MAG: 2-C-methyl-D-erythritol 4-phosphate cytidylyltransferase [Candidatus Marinimicrobia bacterium]|nr:2-C-methyl-D-erythritol 4-phosphate cytidylyltransferase [Candidatus Neomarinimicrobiota bacterium]
MNSVSAIIVAAGRGNRMKARLPKQFLKLDNYTILQHTLTHFGKHPDIDQIILVVAGEYIESRELQNSIPKNFKGRNFVICQGGDSRQESVENGLDKLSQDSQIVIVHDGVRPFISQKIITENIKIAREKGAALTAIPSTDTLKEVQNNEIVTTLDRSRIWKAQTPQTFQKNIIQTAFRKAKQNDFQGTDEASLVEKIHPVHIVQGSKYNFKITHREDLLMARAYLKERASWK